MFKKIIVPKEELQYRLNSIDYKYLINEGNRSIGFFAATQGLIIPTQISPQDVYFYVLEGSMEVNTDDRSFNLKAEEMLLIPKTSAYTLNFLEDTKALTIRL